MSSGCHFPYTRVKASSNAAASFLRCEADFFSISFSLENERSPAQLVTLMHMNTLSAISTLENTDTLSCPKLFFCTMQGESHNLHQEPCSA